MLYSISWDIALIQTIPGIFLIVQIGFRLFNIGIKVKETLYILFIADDFVNVWATKALAYVVYVE